MRFGTSSERDPGLGCPTLPELIVAPIGDCRRQAADLPLAWAEAPRQACSASSRPQATSTRNDRYSMPIRCSGRHTIIGDGGASKVPCHSARGHVMPSPWAGHLRPATSMILRIAPSCPMLWSRRVLLPEIPIGCRQLLTKIGRRAAARLAHAHWSW